MAAPDGTLRDGGTGAADPSALRGGAELGALCSALGQALVAQRRTHEDLERLAGGLGEAVVRRDPQAVSRVTVAQQAALDAMARADAQTRSRVADLSGRLGLPPESRLADVVRRLEERGRTTAAVYLRAAGSDLAAATERTRQANAQNSALLRQATAFTSFALRSLTAGGTGEWSYTGDGARHVADGRRRLVDTKA